MIAFFEVFRNRQVTRGLLKGSFCRYDTDMINIVLLASLLLLVIILLREEMRYRRLVEMERNKSAMLTMLSHQLRTPLTSGKWYLELLMKKEFGAVSVAQLEALHEVDAGVSNALNILNRFLERVRLERTDVTSHPVAVDLGKALQTACANFAHSASEKQVELRQKQNAGRIVAFTDPLLLYAVLDVVLNNAVAYTPEHGTINVSCREEGNRAAIEIADSGIGITADEGKDVFHRFFRGKEAQRVAPHGDGLGLHLAKMLLSRLGGSISFTSEGKGTTFVVALPLAIG